MKTIIQFAFILIVVSAVFAQTNQRKSVHGTNTFRSATTAHRDSFDEQITSQLPSNILANEKARALDEKLKQLERQTNNLEFSLSFSFDYSEPQEDDNTVDSNNALEGKTDETSQTKSISENKPVKVSKMRLIAIILLIIASAPIVYLAMNCRVLIFALLGGGAAAASGLATPLGSEMV